MALNDTYWGWNPIASQLNATPSKLKREIMSAFHHLWLLLITGVKDGAAKSVAPEESLFDAGFTSREEALEYGVRPGDSIVPETETVWTANKQALIGVWDNRYGCAVMLVVMRAVKDKELAATIIAGANAQEEVEYGRSPLPTRCLYCCRTVCQADDTDGNKDKFDS